jgi:hypothetical protein
MFKSLTLRPCFEKHPFAGVFWNRRMGFEKVVEIFWKKRSYNLNRFCRNQIPHSPQ